MALFRKILGRNKKKGGNAYSDFCRNYTMTDIVLGTGSYAEVRKGLKKSTNEVVAVKIIDKSGLSPRELKGLSKEVDILKALRHKNVVRLFDWYEEPEVMYVVMEFVGGGELFTKIINHDAPFTENDARHYIRTLASALKHCKERGIIHRDIKPQNLLLTSKEEGEELKLADFNLSIQLDPDSVNFSVIQTMCGTPNYVAPEILSGKPYDFKCDVWSLGVICFLLLSGGYLPFFVDEEGELGKELLLKKVKKAKWGFYPAEAWEHVSDSAKSFLRSVMEKNPEKRLNYTEVLNHEWMKDGTAAGDQPIDTRAFQQSIYKRQMQCASTVLLAAKKFRDIMEGNDAGNQTFNSISPAIQQDIVDSSNIFHNDLS